MRSDTDTVVSLGSRGSADAEAGWALAVALDCERVDAPPLRLGLGGVAAVEIGRGDVRAVRRAGGRLRLDLADRWASQAHARLERAGAGWRLEDLGSKNGTRVGGRRVDAPTELDDGDVIECGATFLVLRRADAPIEDLELDGPEAGPLRTLSPALERELAVLAKIARASLPVLILGESGTGKEVVATAIHALSRRPGPFVAVNCGALPATLVESELFGTKRGAFSGAEDRPGLVRTADRGTLFLDEVAELPGSSQAALLRVLQEGEVLPLGSERRATVDVRVVAATNRAVDEMIADGRFRRDLFARLRGHEVRLPPLRARLEDLGLLVTALLARIEPERPPRRLSRTAARALFAHSWPFHVRQLEQVLRAAVAVAADEIGRDDLQLGDVGATTPTPTTPTPPTPPTPAADAERERLVALVERHGGNLSAVARDLATSRSQVLRLLARHGLDYRELRRR